MADKEKIVFTKDAVGCYGDSARGQYMVDHVVDFAQAYGFVLDQSCECGYCCASRKIIEVFATEKTGMLTNHYDNDWRASGCEFANEIWDDAEKFLNNITADGLYWGATENGDWGLWEADDE